MVDRPCKTFCCEYFHDGSWWALDITAYDWGDAEARAKKLGLQLKGEHYATIRANASTGALVRIFTWIRNLGVSV
jgi:hypothetical protein